MAGPRAIGAQRLILHSCAGTQCEWRCPYVRNRRVSPHNELSRPSVRSFPVLRLPRWLLYVGQARSNPASTLWVWVTCRQKSCTSFIMWCYVVLVQPRFLPDLCVVGFCVDVDRAF